MYLMASNASRYLIGGSSVNVIEAMHEHRSIRAYKVDPVPEDMLIEILDAGIRASSSGNMQTYSIIVTRDRGLRKQLYKPHMEQSMVLDAPILLTFCVDFNRMRHWCSVFLLLTIIPISKGKYHRGDQ